MNNSQSVRHLDCFAAHTFVAHTNIGTVVWTIPVFNMCLCSVRWIVLLFRWVLMAALTMFNFHITLDDIQQFMSIAITLHCQIPYQTSFYQYSTHSKRVQQKHLFKLCTICSKLLFPYSLIAIWSQLSNYCLGK